MFQNDSNGYIDNDNNQKQKKFESVFDTLRILENKDGDVGGISFKWVKKKVNK